MSHPQSNLTQGFSIRTNIKLDDPNLAVIVFAKLADELGMMPDELNEIIRSGSYLAFQQPPSHYVPGLLLETEEN